MIERAKELTSLDQLLQNQTFVNNELSLHLGSRVNKIQINTIFKQWMSCNDRYRCKCVAQAHGYSALELPTRCTQQCSHTPQCPYASKSHMKNSWGSWLWWWKSKNPLHATQIYICFVNHRTKSLQIQTDLCTSNVSISRSAISRA